MCYRQQHVDIAINGVALMNGWHADGCDVPALHDLDGRRLELGAGAAMAVELLA